MGRFFLTSRGSWGDFNPFLGLGCELKKRGHEVTLIANEFHRSCAKKLGFDFVPYAPESAYHEEQDVNRTIRKPGGVSYEERLNRFNRAELRTTYAALAERADPRDSVIVARSWTMAGRLAQEHLGIPLATVYITPPESLRLWCPHPILGEAPPARWIYDLLYKRMIDKFHDPPHSFINEFRAELGLAPIKHIQSHWFESPQLVLGLWPEWLYPRQTHWSPKMLLTGFVLHETQANAPLPPEVESFLSAGEPPVVFAAGTFRSGGAEDFFAASIEICRRLGRRGVFLSESRRQVPASLPDSIATFPYVPLHALLPRSAALVHHGGIGTTARAIEAGRPQLIVPLFFDQPVNAMRMRKHGVASFVRHGGYQPDRVVPMLQRLLEDAQVSAACAALSRRLAQVDATGIACNALEGLLGSSPRMVEARVRLAS